MVLYPSSFRTAAGTSPQSTERCGELVCLQVIMKSFIVLTHGLLLVFRSKIGKALISSVRSDTSGKFQPFFPAWWNLNDALCDTGFTVSYRERRSLMSLSIRYLNNFHGIPESPQPLTSALFQSVDARTRRNTISQPFILHSKISERNLDLFESS